MKFLKKYLKKGGTVFAWGGEYHSSIIREHKADQDKIRTLRELSVKDQ